MLWQPHSDNPSFVLENTSSKSTFEIWNLLTKTRIKHYLLGSDGVMAWSPNGKYIVSGEGNTQGNMVARVWTAE